MTKLNQMIAVVGERKSTAQKDLTALYHKLQKPDLMSGVIRTYAPLNDGGLKLPDEKRAVQVVADKVLDEIEDITINLMDAVLTVDKGNQIAKANLVVNGHTIAKDVPATTLIFLEKRLSELETVFATIPTLDLDKSWKTGSDNVSVAENVQTHRTEKTQEALVLYPATDKHPAQTQLVSIDKIVGFWTTTALSGALSVGTRKILVDKVRTLKEAVSAAREEANNVEITQQNIGKQIFDFLFEL